jgi:hypothetical protein
MSGPYDPYDRLVCNPIFSYFNKDFDYTQKRPIYYTDGNGTIQQRWIEGPRVMFYWREFDRSNPKNYPVMVTPAGNNE